jgi:transcriptional regulator with XRE-family HTH domain
MRRRRATRQRAKGPIDPRFGARLRELRVAAGMTQAQLAGSEFSKGFISLVETARARASLRAAQILADRLGVPLAELVDPAALSATTLRLRGLLSRAARIESALADADRVRAELAAARAELEQELQARETLETPR